MSNNERPENSNPGGAGTKEKTQKKPFSAWKGLAVLVLIPIIVGSANGTLPDLAKSTFSKLFVSDFTIETTTNLNARGMSEVPAYFFQRSVSEVSIPPSSTLEEGMFEEWANENGGHNVGTTKISLSITAGEKDVDIVGWEIIEKQEVNPLENGILVRTPLGGGPTHNQTVNINLKSGGVYYEKPSEFPGDSESTELNTGLSTISIPAHTSEHFIVRAKSEDGSFSWKLKLHLSVAGKLADYTVETDEGNSFSTRSLADTVTDSYFWTPDTSWSTDWDSLTGSSS